MATSGHVIAHEAQPVHPPRLSTNSATRYPCRLNLSERRKSPRGQAAVQSRQPLHRSSSISIRDIPSLLSWQRAVAILAGKTPYGTPVLSGQQISEKNDGQRKRKAETRHAAYLLPSSSLFSPRIPQRCAKCKKSVHRPAINEPAPNGRWRFKPATPTARRP